MAGKLVKFGSHDTPNLTRLAPGHFEPLCVVAVQCVARRYARTANGANTAIIPSVQASAPQT